jgi:hypothetical protein
VLGAGQLGDLVERMLRTSGRRIDMSNPFVDAMLPDGSRLHTVIPVPTRTAVRLPQDRLRPSPGIAATHVVTEKAVGKHNSLAKLELPMDAADNRRVLAVLGWLEQAAAGGSFSQCMTWRRRFRPAQQPIGRKDASWPTT